ncbi:TonB-dependent receptor [Luteimonas abyssi]|uniref:TonB-dependent receptor n=1 Tax=Luteimonas abyssi TaxID=1247514 RepID=UPI000737B65B|nr:TonB-dependent receptor [Luteimonas abyssi]
MAVAVRAIKTPVTMLAVAISFVLGAQAHAQDQAPPPPPQTTPAADATELDVVRVTGYRASLERALDIKRGEAGVVDAIVAEDIANFPDMNLAESLQRIPGVTITRESGEGRNISVRGLGADFTRVRINGMEALTTVGGTDTSGGTNRGRGFDFNVFASDLFSQLVVRKTSSAEVEEGSLGATVDMRTARPFDYDGFTFAASGQLGYNDLSSDTNPRATALISNTWADNRFGALLSVAFTDRELVEEGSGSGRWASGTSNGGFDPSSPYTPALGADVFHPRIPRYSLIHHDQQRVGVTGALQFAPSRDTEISFDMLYAKIDAERTEDYIEAISFSRGASAGGKPNTIVRDGAVDDRGNLVYGVFDNVDIRSESRIDEWTTEFTQFALSGEHRFNDAVKMNALVGRSKSEHENPIQTTVIMDKFDVDGYSYDYRGNSRLPVFDYGIDPTDPNGWTLAEIRLRPQYVDNTYDTARLDVDWSLTPGFRLKAGLQRKEYSFETTELRRASELDVPTLTPEQLAELTKQVSAYDIPATPGTWVVPDIAAFDQRFGLYSNSGTLQVLPRPVNDRSVTETADSVFVQADFSTDLGQIPFSGNVGVRYVQTSMDSTGYATVSGAPIQARVSREYSDVLPSMNLVAEVAPDMLLRFGAAKVMARSGLGSLTPGVTVNVAGGARTVSGGNPDLDPFRAKTYDLGFEWYYGDGALFGVGLFYKDIDTYVQTVRETRIYADSGLPASLLAGTGASPTDEFVFSVPVNTPGGPLRGAELNLQQPFSFLPGRWSNLGVQFNYTYVDAEISYLDGAGEEIMRTSMVGLSDNAYNATLYYEGDVFSGRVSGTYRSDYLTSVPGRDGNDVEGVKGTTTFDASISWKINDRLQLTLEGLNLTDEYQDEWVDSVADRSSVYYHTGRQYMLGMRYRF